MDLSDLRQHELNDTVIGVDIDGNPHRRKILTGLRRGEFVLTRHSKGVGMIRFRDLPAKIYLTDIATGKSVAKALPTDDDGRPVRMFYLLSENAMSDAATAGFEVQPSDETDERAIAAKLRTENASPAPPRAPELQLFQKIDQLATTGNAS